LKLTKNRGARRPVVILKRAKTSLKPLIEAVKVGRFKTSEIADQEKWNSAITSRPFYRSFIP